MTAKLRIGGVLRCCVQTLESREPQPDDTPGSTVLDCDHCSSGLRLANDGVWEWNRPSDSDPGAA